jgi:hypothetical protein
MGAACGSVRSLRKVQSSFSLCQYRVNSAILPIARFGFAMTAISVILSNGVMLTDHVPILRTRHPGRTDESSAIGIWNRRSHFHSGPIILESLAAIQTSDISVAGFRDCFTRRCNRKCKPAMAATKQQVHYCKHHPVLTCSCHHLARRRNQVSLVVPMLPTRFHTAEYFVAVKRLRQYVPSAEIQSYTPKAVIRKP